MSKKLTTVEVADEIKTVMEDENFVPSPEDIECYGKHQIKPSEILPCPLCGSEYLQFGDWGTHGAYDKVACGNGCTDWLPVERWNSRPVKEALQKRIEELEAEHDRMRKALEEIAQWDMLARSTRGLVAIIEVLKDRARKALEGAGE